MSLACRACEGAAKYDGREFDGGYLHPSMDYPSLLHCNFCGAYYKLERGTLHFIPQLELSDYQKVSG